jgi:hypothetical protein
VTRREGGRPFVFRARTPSGGRRWFGGYRTVRNGRIYNQGVIGGYGHETWEAAARESIAYVERQNRLRHGRDVAEVMRRR